MSDPGFAAPGLPAQPQRPWSGSSPSAHQQIDEAPGQPPRKRKYVSIRARPNPLVAGLELLFTGLMASQSGESRVAQIGESQQVEDPREASAASPALEAGNNPREEDFGDMQLPVEGAPMRGTSPRPDSSTKETEAHPVHRLHQPLKPQNPYLAAARSDSSTLITSKLTHHQSMGRIEQTSKPPVLKRLRKQTGTGPVEYTYSMKSRRL